MLRIFFKLAYVANTLIETLIIVRILLSLFASNSTHAFVEWVYNISDIFISPFEGVAPSILVIDRFEIAITPIIALLFYAIIGFVLSELMKAFSND
jgi:uncharacterized protein YggT (Ycf19 family)